MEDIYVAGAISVKAVVENRKREVFSVYCTEKKYRSSKDIKYIIEKCKENGIRYEFVDESFFENPSFGKTHGYICASIGQRSDVDLADIFENDVPFIIYIDGIEDPYNLGESIRSAYAAGATAVILPNRVWENALGTVIKSSAGAFEKIEIVYTDELEKVVEMCRKNNIKIVAATRKNAVELYEEDLDCPVLLLIGGEKRGLSSRISDMADSRVFIPYGNPFRNALSTSSAISVLSFERLRQRKNQVSK